MKFLIKKLFLSKSYHLKEAILKQKKYYYLANKNKENYVLSIVYRYLYIFYNLRIQLKLGCEVVPTSECSEAIFRHPVGIIIGGGARLSEGVIVDIGQYFRHKKVKFLSSFS